MLLKKIKLKNFRQFIGEQKVEFETEEKHNITVILGDNTSGKTTFIKSFKWILYGKTDFNTKSLLNSTVAEELKPRNKEKVFGEIELLHKDRLYILRREQSYFMNNSGEIKPENSRFIVQYKTEDGQLKYLDKNQQINIVNKILPEDLSEYFFFHGEQIKNIGENKRSGKKNIKEAVESMLGLETLNSAITHLSGGEKTSVIGKLNNEIDSTEDKELDEKKNLLSKKKKEINKIGKEIEEDEEIINAYEEQISELNVKIKDNADTKKLKTEIEYNNKEINKKKKEKKSLINEFTKEISQHSPMFFMQPLLIKGLEMINSFEGIDEGIPGMEAKAIDYLIENRKECICGNKITKNSEAYNNLKELKKYLPPESIGTIVRLFNKDIKYYNSISNDFYDKILNIVQNIRTNNNKIQKLESLNDNYSEEIKNKPDVGDLEREVNELNKKINSRRNEKEDLIKRKGNLESKIKELNSDIEKLAQKDDKNKFILECLKYAKNINQKFKDHYISLEKEIKDRLENRTNEIFNKIYHGNRDLVLKDNYEYDFTTTDLSNNKTLDPSEGLKTVASFSFIAGIVSLAKEKVHNTKNEDIDQIDTEPYPLVMDAPFSDTDEKHVKNISKIIPDVAEQTIMIIMDKDWEYAKKVLDYKLSKLYIMNKQKETITYIEEVD
ncbi:MAG: AAA family ATPase [Bacillota bacterium]